MPHPIDPGGSSSLPANVDLSPKPSSIDTVAQAAYGAGFRGKALRTAIAVAFAESTHAGVVLDEHAIGDLNLTERGEMSVGWWQINYRPSRDRGDKVRDPVANLNGRTNAKHAYQISSGGSNFRPWSTYTNGAYKAHLTSAGWAADRVEHGETLDSSTGAPGVQTVDPGRPVLARKLKTNAALPIRLGGVALDTELGARVTGGSVDLTLEEASQVTLELEVDDPAAAWHQFDDGVPGVRAGTQLDYAHHRLEVISLGIKQGPSEHPLIVLKAQPPAIVRMREAYPPLKAQRSVSPTQYLAQMADDVGLHFVGEPSAKRDSVGPTQVSNAGQQRLESPWEVAQRLAQELGWTLFEALGTLYFGSEPWLIQHGRHYQLCVRHMVMPGVNATNVDSIGYPTVTRARTSAPGGYTAAVDVSATVAREHGETIVPGAKLSVAGTYLFDTSSAPTSGYIITRVSWPLDSLVTPVTIGARDYRQPVPKATAGGTSDAIDTGTGEAVTGPIGKSKSALDFVTLCLRQVGDAYVWGAHPTTAADPGAFDCSGLVGWAAEHVGVSFHGSSGMQYEAARKAGRLISVAKAERTRGAVLFRGYHGSEHIAVSLGDGKHTVEARGRAYGVVKGPIAGREWDSAALIPGMRY